MMRLVSLEKIKHFAIAKLANGRTLHAEFLLDGADTYIKIYSDTDICDDYVLLDNLDALLTDGTSVTFLQNVRSSDGGTISGDTRSYFVRLRPSFVTLGPRHHNCVTKIRSVSFCVNDAHVIYHDTDAFGHIFEAKDCIDGVVESQEKYLGRTIIRGERPIISYFTGKSLIFEANTQMGRISASHSVSKPASRSDGVQIDSKIFTTVDLGSPVSMEAVFEILIVLLRFLEIVAGRRQSIFNIHVQLDHPDEPFPVELYWCMRPYVRNDASDLDPEELPINAGLDPTQFGMILTNWVAENHRRNDARSRFSDCFSKQYRYDVDRIVGAANMFDIMPYSIDSVILSDDLVSARDKTQHLFKELPESPERNSILDALGRIGKPSLRKKVQSRVEIILVEAGRYFPDLPLVVDEAIKCRNYYVHGTRQKLNYSGASEILVPFFTNTLEFVFSASEFIEAGWKFEAWRKQGSTMSHPWGRYAVTYASDLKVLKRHLAGLT